MHPASDSGLLKYLIDASMPCISRGQKVLNQLNAWFDVLPEMFGTAAFVHE
jgi:hypothetical protein